MIASPVVATTSASSQTCCWSGTHSFVVMVVLRCGTQSLVVFVLLFAPQRWPGQPRRGARVVRAIDVVLALLRVGSGSARRKACSSPPGAPQKKGEKIGERETSLVTFAGTSPVGISPAATRAE